MRGRLFQSEGTSVILLINDNKENEMLNKQIKQFILEHGSSSAKVELFKEEKEYVEKNQLISGATVVEKPANQRFAEAYIERCDKETESILAKEDFQFLQQPLYTYVSI
ncbi:hypothetical protein ACI2OX_11670 [Bacillus sp. N9]